MGVRQMLVDKSKYGIKCPYDMNAQFIVVHNTANNASANNEIQYMISNNNQVSFHYAVDEKEVVQGIPENRNAWHAGDGANGQGNRYGIAIEICRSTGDLDAFKNCEANAAKFIAQKLKEKGWGIDKVKKHQDFMNKNCPHKTLELGWQRFLNMIRVELNGTQSATPTNPVDQILEKGSRVTSVPMSITGVKNVDGIECANIPALGGWFPTKYISEYDASDGAKDNYLATTRAKVYVDETVVEKVDIKNNLVMIHGIWVHPAPLTEI